jgi:hypothetical protein
MEPQTRNARYQAYRRRLRRERRLIWATVFCAWARHIWPRWELWAAAARVALRAWFAATFGPWQRADLINRRD